MLLLDYVKQALQAALAGYLTPFEASASHNQLLTLPATCRCNMCLTMIENRFNKEAECGIAFRRMGTVFNANTPENHPVIFNKPADYQAAISILAVAVRMMPGITVYAFQIMSNHIHLVIGGDKQRIQEFFAYFVGRLEKYFGGRIDFSRFELKLFPVNDLSYLRNAIVYVNRNGFVVHNEYTPFSYPWGSSAYFFQPIAVRYAQVSGKAIGNSVLRSLVHSKSCDHLKDLKMVDGSISPLEFTDIHVAESVFRDAKQYFYMISRNVETYSDVARSIGESVYYNDNDLYVAATRFASGQYGMNDLRTLPVAAKLELAKYLHFEYNASIKQLQRMLSIDGDVLKAMF